MTIFSQIATKIIKEQELIIGPLSWSEAKKVPGLNVTNEASREDSLSGDEKEVLNKLVMQYERLFGRASHEVCREAAVDLIADLPPAEVPANLR